MTDQIDRIAKAIQDKLVELSDECGEARDEMIAGLQEGEPIVLLEPRFDLLKELRSTYALLETETVFIRSIGDVEDRIEILGNHTVIESDPIGKAFRRVVAFLSTLID